MELFPRIPNSLKLFLATAVCAVVLISCSDNSISNPQTINIHAGSAGGSYSDLINTLNERVDNLKESGCSETDELCALTKFIFEPACDNGGSKPNLQRLGMELIDSDESPNNNNPCTKNELPRPTEGNDFAFVQNYYISGATQTYCSKQERSDLRFYEVPWAWWSSYEKVFNSEWGIKLNGSRILHDLRLKRMSPELSTNSDSRWVKNFDPWPVRWIDTQCETYFENEMDGEKYKPFDDLRIVLPLYPGIVQFIARQDIPAEGSDEAQPDRVELQDLERGYVYLQGVNTKYGNEILDRDPRLLGKEPTLLNGSHIQSLERLKLAMESREQIVEQEWTDEQWDAINDFIITPSINQTEKGNRMLACGIIDTYVISGDIIEDGREVIIRQESNRVEEEDTEYTIFITPEQFAALPEGCDKNFQLQQIQIPEVIIDGLVEDHPYYQLLDRPANWEDKSISVMPGLITYLVTTASANEELVYQLTSAMVLGWNQLMLIEQDLSPIRDNVLKKPAPYHPGAERALNEEDLLGGGFSIFQIAFVLAILLAFLILNYLWRATLGYDRLGEKQGYGFKSMFGQGFFDVVIIVVGWWWIFMVVVTVIRFWDASIATTQNTDDQLSGLSFTRTLLWMFTFISSGYEDDVFPTSSASRVVVSSFAIAGVAYPLYLIAKAWDRMRTLRLSRARGGEYRGAWRMAKDWWLDRWPYAFRSKGILLLCGWSSKGPGLVYTLTCPDSPFEGMVNIVANLEVEYPIEHYGFNKSRVRFYRGDPSHRSQLERAEALRAETAIILTDETSGAGQNSASVLTALAIEKLKEEIVVSADVTMHSGTRDFTEDHIDNVLDPKLTARQLLTLGCFDNYALDFALDALSPDDHCEWYSKKVSELKKIAPNSKKIKTVSDLSKSLQRIGIVVVAVAKNVASKSDRVQFKFDYLMSIESLEHTPSDDDYIICAAKDPSSFKRKRIGKFGATAFVRKPDSIVHNWRTSASILVIGHKEQAESISKHIKRTVSEMSIATTNVSTSSIATDELKGKKLDEAIAEALKEKSWTHILLLSSISSSRRAGEYAKLAVGADSDTIMRANFIRVEVNKLERKPIIIAEVNNTHSRQLATDADVTTVVPSSLLIERLLARTASGGGAVSEIMRSLLSMRGDVYLRSFTLHPDHPLLGETYASALNTWFDDGRVVGIFPRSSEPEKEKYSNDSDDFDWHFIMCPPKAEKNYKLRERDVVVSLAYSNRTKNE